MPTPGFHPGRYSFAHHSPPSIYRTEPLRQTAQCPSLRAPNHPHFQEHHPSFNVCSCGLVGTCPGIAIVETYIDTHRATTYASIPLRQGAVLGRHPPPVCADTWKN